MKEQPNYNCAGSIPVGFPSRWQKPAKNAINKRHERRSKIWKIKNKNKNKAIRLTVQELRFRTRMAIFQESWWNRERAARKPYTWEGKEKGKLPLLRMQQVKASHEEKISTTPPIIVGLFNAYITNASHALVVISVVNKKATNKVIWIRLWRTRERKWVLEKNFFGAGRGRKQQPWRRDIWGRYSSSPTSSWSGAPNWR